MHRLAMIAFLGMVTASVPAAAEQTLWPGADAWDEPIITGSISARGRHPDSDVSNAGAAIPQQLRVGNNSVRFGTVAGTPGAEIDRDGSAMTIGVAVAPAFAGTGDGSSLSGLGDLDTDLTGALEFSLQDGPVSPSVSVSGPITGDGRGGRESAFRTMFGMDYKF